MRVLIISWEYPPYIEGGLGRHVADLSPALAEQGVEVQVITPVGEPTVAQLRQQAKAVSSTGGVPAAKKVIREAEVSREDNVIVHRLLTSHRNTKADIYSRVTQVNQALVRYADRLRDQYGPCGVIHTHDWLTGMAAMAVQKKWGCPLIATIHATERGRSRGWMYSDLQHAIDAAERELIQEADKVIVCSQHMYHELQSFFQVPDEKLAVVPNGVNFESLHNPSDPEDLSEFRAKYARPGEKIVFTVARLVFEKGIHILVGAAPKIFADCPNTKMIIAGKGPEAENLKRQAQGLGVADRVQFAGFVSDEDRNRLFKVADCAVFPSLYEPFGIVALEAMALDCPVVVSDVGGLSEVVTHRETGITIYPDNVDSLAWGVTRALKDRNWTKEHIVNARQWVEDNFNWLRIAELTRDVYQEFLDTPQQDS